MADGYARASGRHGVCIAQNGPGITNFVTAIAAAYWAHSPVVFITPETGSMTMGLGGFQETEQLPIFSKITKYQGHVNNPRRMAEIAGALLRPRDARDGARRSSTSRATISTATSRRRSRPPMRIGRGAGDAAALDEAAALLAAAKFPVILAGGGVIMSGATAEAAALAELLHAPVCNSYLHNDSFPASHPLWCGPLGYQGSKAAMKLIAQADVVLALGTRLGPFGTLPQYGMEYWPANAKIIQVDADPRVLGLVKPVSVGICGDARAAAAALLQRLAGPRAGRVREPRTAQGTDRRPRRPPGSRSSPRGPTSATRTPSRSRRTRRTCTRARCCASSRRRCRRTRWCRPTSATSARCRTRYLRFEEPRSMFAAMSFGNCGYAFPVICGAKVARPDRPAIAYVGDGAWGISLNELLTCAREKIGVTVVVFNNGQWGAEKKNHVDFYSRRFQGVNLENPSWAAVAQGLRLRGRDGRTARRRRTRAAGVGAGAGRRDVHRARDDGHAGTRRPVPPRRAVEAGALPREVSRLRLTGAGVAIRPLAAVRFGLSAHERPVSAHELAQLNIALMKEPLESPAMAGFVDNLERINALADRSPGFVWRLQSDDGDATSVRPLGELTLVNLSVWRDLESLNQFVYRSGHVEIMRRRKEWFERMGEAFVVLWWAARAPPDRRGCRREARTAAYGRGITRGLHLPQGLRTSR